VCTDDRGYITAKYFQFVEVFSKTKAETVAPHLSIDDTIDIEPSYQLPYQRTYNLSHIELRTHKAYIDTKLANGFIQQLASMTAAPIVFANMTDGGLRLSVDYLALNKSTVENRYPLPLIGEMLDRLCGACIITKLDLQNAYHLIRNKQGDEYKRAFRIRYSQFKYRVIPFGLTTTQATFQSYIDDCLQPSIDDFAVCYLDDISIHSTHEKEHKAHVHKELG